MTYHDPARVRAWAKAQGLPVGDRGRLKPEVLAAFEQASPVVPLTKPFAKPRRPRTGAATRTSPIPAPRTIAPRPRVAARSGFTIKAPNS